MQEQEVITNHNAEIISHLQPQTVRRREPELFEEYEMKGWKFTPRIYKIFAASAIINILFLVTVAQADLLQTKACNSPLVGKVCQVLDTVYLGSVLLGTESEFVSEDYEKTSLEDADITYIDVSNVTPPLEYPEGYFAVANPEQFSVIQQADMSGFPYPSPYGANPTIPNPTLPGNDLMNTPQVLPTPNNNPIVGEIPSSPLGNNPTVTIPKPRQNRMPKVRNQSPNKLPELDGDETAENKPEEKKEEKKPEVKSEPVEEFRPNKKPLQDFADAVVEKRGKEGNLDLTKKFKVVINGVLDKEGKLDPTKSGYDPKQTQGDEEMVNLAKSAVEAINNSGLFYYLKNLGVEKVTFTLEQTDKEIVAIVKSSQPSEERAKTISSGFNGLMLLANTTVKEEELQTLLKAANFKPEGKDFILTFNLDKPTAHGLINRKLDEAQQKANNQQPNSTTETPDANQKTGR